jgi:catechol 2,3-dioxygenase-like lactoylglutathione lyase family enzyme
MNKPDLQTPQSSLDHVGLTVPDIDAATKLFSALLGATELFDMGPFQSGDDWMAVNLGVHPRAVLRRLRMLTLPQGGMLELFEYEGPGSEAAVPANSQVGGNHVAFKVADMDAAVERAKALGLQVQGPVKRLTDGPGRGLSWVYFLAPWGQQLEFVQQPQPWPAGD